MAIVVPSAESVKSLAFPLTEKQRIVAQTLLEVLESHPPQPYPAVGLDKTALIGYVLLKEALSVAFQLPLPLEGDMNSSLKVRHSKA